jgi:hypothetical protein
MAMIPLNLGNVAYLRHANHTCIFYSTDVWYLKAPEFALEFEFGFALDSHGCIARLLNCSWRLNLILFLLVIIPGESFGHFFPS